MIRNAKTPSILLFFLIVIILIITYNYWGLSQKNLLLKQTIIADEEKLNNIIDAKVSMDKENELNLNKIKELEEKLESDRLALKQKDIDIDDLNSKLKSKTQDSDNSQIEVNDLKDKLEKCNTQKSEVDSRLLSMLAFFNLLFTIKNWLTLVIFLRN